jgi:hypothetical protein
VELGSSRKKPFELKTMKRPSREMEGRMFVTPTRMFDRTKRVASAAAGSTSWLFVSVIWKMRRWA